jgi:hypothetical protein
MSSPIPPDSTDRHFIDAYSSEVLGANDSTDKRRLSDFATPFPLGNVANADHKDPIDAVEFSGGKRPSAQMTSNA